MNICPDGPPVLAARDVIKNLAFKPVMAVSDRSGYQSTSVDITSKLEAANNGGEKGEGGQGNKEWGMDSSENPIWLRIR